MSARLARIASTYDYNSKKKIITLKKDRVEGYEDKEFTRRFKINVGDICLIFDPKNDENIIIDNSYLYNRILINGRVLWVNSKYIYPELTKAEVY